MDSSVTHTVVLGVANNLAASHLRHLLEGHPRFQLVAVAENAVQTLTVTAAEKPAVVVMADTSPGLRGREVLAEMAESSPETLVIITTPGDPSALRESPGVAESIPEDDSAAVVAALDSLAAFLDNPTASDGPERRILPDRRLVQDWSQVFAERRVSVRR